MNIQNTNNSYTTDGKVIQYNHFRVLFGINSREIKDFQFRNPITRVVAFI